MIKFREIMLSVTMVLVMHTNPKNVYFYSGTTTLSMADNFKIFSYKHIVPLSKMFLKRYKRIFLDDLNLKKNYDNKFFIRSQGLISDF